MHKIYDVIVIGGGHAGCEAAAAAATMGSHVLLVTLNLNTIGQMSCNPAMGGIAKGQIVREIDALGGMSGIIADKSTLQFRMLNLSKGPAMWSPRTQNDRMKFAHEWRMYLESISKIDFWQDGVKELLIKNNKIIGIKTNIGLEFKSKAVILACGTFMNGIIHIGKRNMEGGRIAEKASYGITEQLKSLGFESSKLKTGTSPRADGRTLDYSKMEEQKGDINPSKFSFSNLTKSINRQKSCYITYTNNIVHQIIKEGKKDSPMYNGRIKGSGPRYCPSIEDKVTRFADKERHQIFVEPEGQDTIEVYVNGFSSSLSFETQYEAIKQIPGFENVKLFKPGYAIEYDFFQPTQLKKTLETKAIHNLYFAGQINGTTGYEEAACQGLMAGINAHLKINDENSFILDRSDAYIGVLIDDLVLKGTQEPYRMFTSRAECRILLRQDNADIRLTEKGHKLGLATPERMENVANKFNEVTQIIDIIKKTKVGFEINPFLQKRSSAEIKEKVTLNKLLKRPNIFLSDLKDFDENLKNELNNFNEIAQEQAEIQLKYESYIMKEKEQVEKLKNLAELKIPYNLDYSKIKGLSSEGKEKLTTIMPETILDATNISGVSHADISILLISLNR